MEQKAVKEMPVSEPSPLAEEMMKAGLHFGHRTSKTHPNMKPYIMGMRNAVHLIDVKFTQEKLQEALAHIQKLREEGKIILFVGTRTSIKGLLRNLAETCKVPFVADRWIGGTLTNFEMTRKRLDELKELGEAKEQGIWEKYTKKERLDLGRRMEELEERYGGIKQLAGAPDALFVCDLDENEIAVKEAKKLGVKVIALVDTNNNPATVDFPIPANNDAPSAVAYILGKIQEVLLKTRPAA